MCGLKAIPLRASKGAWAILAIASKRISRDARAALAAEVLEIEHVIEVRSWVRTSLGELAEFLRKRRTKAAPTLTAYEKRVAEMASKDRFLLGEIEELDVENAAAAIERFAELAADGVKQGFVSSLPAASSIVEAYRAARFPDSPASARQVAPTLPEVLAPVQPPAAALSNVELVREFMRRNGLNVADIASIVGWRAEDLPSLHNPPAPAPES
jgi:hypothetical protein